MVPEVIRRAARGRSSSLQHVRIELSPSRACGPEFLDGADDVASFEQVGGEGVAKGVRADRLGDTGGLRGLADGFLHRALAGVPAVDDAGFGVLG